MRVVYWCDTRGTMGESEQNPYDQLNERQQRFVDEFLKDPNATQAAIRAGYSERTAYRTAADNLRKPQICAAIARHRKERCERTKIDADWVLAELKDLYREQRGKDGSPFVAKSTLDSIGKHVDVQAFKERGGDASVYDALDYILERRERRQLNKGNGEDNTKEIGAGDEPRAA